MATRSSSKASASTPAAAPLAVIQPASRNTQAEFRKVFNALFSTREALLLIEDRTSSAYKTVLYDFLEQMVSHPHVLIVGTSLKPL